MIKLTAKRVGMPIANALAVCSGVAGFGGSSQPSEEEEEEEESRKSRKGVVLASTLGERTIAII